jgi:hypothetical protein
MPYCHVARRPALRSQPLSQLNLSNPATMSCCRRPALCRLNHGPHAHPACRPQCARGTFKATAANSDCTPCPTGLTTLNGTVAANSPLNCTVLLPGYAITSAVLGTTEGTECPEGQFRGTEVVITNGATVGCSSCGPGLAIPPNVTGSSALPCVTLPGYGLSNATGSATICAAGTL